MRELNSAEIREVQLRILHSVDAFCREHNLRYSLGGGTLLGAIRHGGYIPWDDDIDLMMPRVDYEYLLENYTHPDFTACYWSDGGGQGKRNWNFPFAKIADNHSTITQDGVPMGEGVNIDIFPVDGVSDNPTELRVHLQKIQKLKAVLVHKRPDAPRGIRTMVARFFALSFVQRALKKLCKKYDFADSPLAGSLVGAYGSREVYAKEVFESYTTAKFEGVDYRVIAQWDKYLSQHYGNYMELPPEHKRKAPHNIRAFSNV